MGCWAEGLLGSWQSCFLTWVLVIGCYLMIIHYAILLFCRSFLLCVFYLHLEVYFLKGVCVVVVQSSSRVRLCAFFKKSYFWVLSSFGILPKCVNIWILFVESGSLLLTLDTPPPAPPYWEPWELLFRIFYSEEGLVEFKQLTRAETNSSFWHKGVLKLESVDELRNPWNRATYFCMCVCEHFSGKRMQSFYWPSKWSLASNSLECLSEADEAVRSLRPLEHGSEGGCPLLTREKVPLWIPVVFFVSLSPRCPVVGLGHGSSRRSPSSQTVSAFQFMPVSGLTEAQPFLFNLNLWVFPDISLHSTKLHNIIFERSAIPLYSNFFNVVFL